MIGDIRRAVCTAPRRFVTGSIDLTHVSGAGPLGYDGAASAHQSGGSVVTESNPRSSRTVSAAAALASKTAVVSAEL